MGAQRIAPVMLAVGLVACGGSSSTPEASSNALAAALAASVHFADGQLLVGTLAKEDASLAKVTLGSIDKPLSIAPGQASIMALDITNPDEDTQPVSATLLQFSGADSYVKVPSSKIEKGSGQNDVVHFMDSYTVDDDLCTALCNRVYTTQIEVTVLVDGKASQHRKYDVEVDCSAKGDPKSCSAADKRARDSDGGTPPKADAGAKPGMDAGGMQSDAGVPAMDAAPGGADAAQASVDAGKQGSAGTTATAGAGGAAGSAGGGNAGSGGSAGSGSGSGGGPSTDLDAGVEDAATTPVCDAGAGAGASHVIMQFDSVNPERVTSLQWIDSTQTMSANLVSNNAGTGCPGGNEFFGQAYGAPEGSTIVGGIGAGQKATLMQCGLETNVNLDATDCNSAAQLAITTKYSFYSDARVDEVRIERTWPFDASTAINSGTGLRPYVPRVAYGTFTTVIYPNQAGTGVTGTTVTSCPGDCITATGTSWNGRWLADIAPTTGYAMIIVRDPAMTSDVDLTINYDSSSASNLSSFVIVQPVSGWKAAITEVEYLCFADLTTWPQAQRDAAQLPAGCGP